jgi:hypothetical protein
MKRIGLVLLLALVVGCGDAAGAHEDQTCIAVDFDACEAACNQEHPNVVATGSGDACFTDDHDDCVGLNQPVISYGGATGCCWLEQTPTHENNLVFRECMLTH